MLTSMKKMLVLLLAFIAMNETLLAQEFGVQLYTFRNQLSKDVPGTLAKIKEMGIKEIEGGGTNGLSVEEYKKLVMFRNALNYAQKAGEDTTLTDVALYSLYYDQAHYIKHFKAITKQSPKALLSKLTDLGSHEEVYWNFED